MTNPSSQSDSTVLHNLGERLGRHRLDHNLTQADLAAAAGVSKRTVERLEAGDSTQLSNFIRILRALDLLDGLDTGIPNPPPSPIDQLKMQGKQRRRASPLRNSGVQENKAHWTWNDKP